MTTKKMIDAPIATEYVATSDDNRPRLVPPNIVPNSSSSIPYQVVQGTLDALNEIESTSVEDLEIVNQVVTFETNIDELLVDTVFDDQLSEYLLMMIDDYLMSVGVSVDESSSIVDDGDQDTMVKLRNIITVSESLFSNEWE
jgi:hypothetical protein